MRAGESISAARRSALGGQSTAAALDGKVSASPSLVPRKYAALVPRPRRSPRGVRSTRPHAGDDCEAVDAAPRLLIARTRGDRGGRLARSVACHICHHPLMKMIQATMRLDANTVKGGGDASFAAMLIAPP